MSAANLAALQVPAHDTQEKGRSSSEGNLQEHFNAQVIESGVMHK